MECGLLPSLAAVAVLERLAYLVRTRTQRLVPAVLIVVVAITAAACETSSTISAGPDPVKCQVALTSPPMMEAAGGNGSITVATQPECAWTASTSAGWISSLSPSSGQGNGTVSFRVAANDGAALREGTVTINNEQARVSQRAPCRFTLTPASQTVATSGGASTVGVATDGDCSWTATTETPWITLTGPTTGTGPAVIGFTFSPNIGAERTGSIVVAGQRATVIQGAAATPTPPTCDASISPTSESIGASGGAGTPITVTSAAGCAWSAGSTVPWITITAGATGSGNGTVTFLVAANTGAARTGTIAIASHVFTVSQSAGATPPPACTYSIAPPSQTAPATASTGTLTVTTTAACSWTAVSGVPWITVTTGAAGTGNGTVGFSIGANAGAERAGTITIATQTFTVNQAAAATACTYSIAPTSQDVAASATTGTVTVTAGAGCTWTGTSGVPWITVTSGASGSGNGSVGFSVAANTGTARSGTMTIAGQGFTVNQAAPCTYSIAPTSQDVSASAATGTVTVTAGAGCAWTATSGVPWISVMSGASGTGNGSVGFSVAANTGTARSGTISIAGQTFTVNQAAFVPACTYTLSASSQSVPAAGATGSVGVMTATGCTWTASSNVPWLTVTSGASGSGNGTVGFSAAANSGALRTGVLTIGSQTFTVTQVGAIGPLRSQSP